MVGTSSKKPQSDPIRRASRTLRAHCGGSQRTILRRENFASRYLLDSRSTTERCEIRHRSRFMVCIFAIVRLAAWDAFSTLGCVGTRLTVFGRHDCSSIDVWPTGETLSSRTRIIESDTASAVMSYRFLPVHSQALDQVLPGGPTGPAFHGRMVVAPNTYSPTCAVHAAIIVDFVGRTSHSLPCEIKARDDQHCRSTYSRVVRKSGGDLTGPHACRKDGISRQRLETSDI